MKILVIGISVRAMVESAVHSGYSVVALDAFGDRDLRALAETYSLRRDFCLPYSPDALYRTGCRLGCDALAYTSNLENHPGVLERFSQDCRVIGNSAQSIRAVRDWPVLYSKLRNAGFAVPETVFDAKRNGEQWLIKPVRSGGGHGISFAPENVVPDERHLLQRFIPGKPCSASFVSNGSECVLLGITEQLVGRPHFGVNGFRYCGNILPLAELREESTAGAILNQVRAVMRFLTREFGLTGVNGFDFILNDGRIWLTEVNPRYSASMELIEQAYGIPVFDLHVQSVLNGRLPEFKLESLLNIGRFFGKSILFCESELLVPDTSGWTARGIKDIPPFSGRLREGSPICTILASGTTHEETLGTLHLKAAELKETLYG